MPPSFRKKRAFCAAGEVIGASGPTDIEAANTSTSDKRAFLAIISFSNAGIKSLIKPTFEADSVDVKKGRSFFLPCTTAFSTVLQRFQIILAKSASSPSIIEPELIIMPNHCRRRCRKSPISSSCASPSSLHSRDPIYGHVFWISINNVRTLYLRSGERTNTSTLLHQFTSAALQHSRTKAWAAARPLATSMSSSVSRTSVSSPSNTSRGPSSIALFWMLSSAPITDRFST